FTRGSRRIGFTQVSQKLRAVHLEDPTGRHWPIRYRDLSRPPITLWEQKVAVKAKREQGMRKVDESAIFAAVEARRATIAEAAERTRAARREQQRTAHLTSGRGTGTSAKEMVRTSSEPAAISAPDEAQIPMPDNMELDSRKQHSMVEQSTTPIGSVSGSAMPDDAKVPMPVPGETRIVGRSS
ncbi:hypothetical protein, partial [Muricoccus vinaceus]